MLTSKQPSPLLAITFVIVWLLMVISGFWWFQLKNVQAFASGQQVEFFQGSSFSQQLSQLSRSQGPGDKRVTLVHFWDPACSCNRFNEPHVKNLIEQYAQQGVEFVIVARVDSVKRKAEVLEQARNIFAHPSVIRVIADLDAQMESMPSSPAVAVMNEQQQLMYFGPYSVGAVCNVKNGAFVEQVLDGMASGNSRQQINILATGCFCTWNDKKKVT